MDAAMRKICICIFKSFLISKLIAWPADECMITEHRRKKLGTFGQFGSDLFKCICVHNETEIDYWVLIAGAATCQ